MKEIKTGGLKVLMSWLVVFALRLIPHRIPNFEGVLATLMPVSKRFGSLVAFFYGALAITLYDLATGFVGSWTLLTAITYGTVGAVSAIYFKNREMSRGNSVKFAVIATLFYDLVTGVIAGPVLFGQPIVVAFFGQIPFTLYHLAGNVILAYLVTPALYKWVVQNESLELDVLWRRAFVKAN